MSRIPSRYTRSQPIASQDNPKIRLTHSLQRGTKDSTDAHWTEDAGFKEYSAFVQKYMPPPNIAYGLGAATMVQVIKQSRNYLSRESAMKQAANLKDLELPMLLPGIKINTSPDTTISGQFARRRSPRSGESWAQFGEL